MDKVQAIQESQYDFPYHYIPTTDGGFSQVQYWSWGFRYLGGLRVVMDLLKETSCESLIDVGCGDGRFLQEVRRSSLRTRRLCGVDYSERAVALANALNPDIDFRCHDILEEPIGEKFDVVTVIEVLEHIPVGDVPQFLAAIGDLLRPGGRLIGTVPHQNKKVSEKHYQHFSSDKLDKLLHGEFTNCKYQPFDNCRAITPRLGLKLLGGKGRHIVVTNRTMWGLFFTIYKRSYLYLSDESNCGRIAFVGTRRG